MEFERISDLKMPETMEDCWRCGNQSHGHKMKPAKDIRTGREGGETVYIQMCSHCGYVVPRDRGFDSPEMAVLRWNGDQIAQRNRVEKEKSVLITGIASPKD